MGGEEYGPRLERLERLHGELCRGFAGARTLGGCRLVPSGDEVLVCREPARVALPERKMMVRLPSPPELE